MISGGGVHTVLGQQTRPGVGHQSPQLVALLLVGGVVDVSSALVHQQTGELEQQDPNIVTRPEWVLRVNDVLDEGGDHVGVVLVIWGRGTAD